MRILYKDILSTGILTFTDLLGNEIGFNRNFPAGNLFIQQPSIPARVQLGGMNLVIVSAFTFPVTIDCVACDNTNATSIAVTGKNADGNDVPILPYVQCDSSNYADVLYFDAVELSEISVYFRCTDNTQTCLEIGNVMAGKSLEMPNPNAYYSEESEMTSEYERLRMGGGYGTMGTVLRKIEHTYTFVTKDKKDEIEKMVSTCRNVNNMYIDCTDKNHDCKKPIYGRISATSISKVRKTPFLSPFYTIGISYEEVQ